ncbi:MAG: epoxyqueuosine reductase QueH [Lachnospiraceae bacterium]|jgi:predicted adenine nucleotide alpha hydrolase (AANH) superfamily ATPase|nr:epoxyqueuosine reductase QueH [Lachnospiraceae bacterium]
MNRMNYQRALDQIIGHLNEEKRRPTLLLHSCCAPCSSYCLEYLSQYFAITVYYYNPNITEKEEYLHRVSEQERLVKEFPTVSFREGPYDPERFFEAARGLEKVPEGGERCFRCYELRLREAVQEARRQGADYVTTTLSISPLKNAAKLNEIGERLAGEYGVCWLPGDFKKRDGYKRSVELSVRYGLYRQNYCGCIYSKEEARRREEGAGQSQEDTVTAGEEDTCE